MIELKKKHSILTTIQGRLVLKHHQGSLLVAIKDLYPELNFRPDLGVIGKALGLLLFTQGS